ncbi:hypothetical protein OG921_12760 [Aldersonia sp. NBC_00410]|nr:hypothetical protein [Aldersonia sp. NBC_00410]MCX5044040.1 hypothetical protein [Aldersonia sp. NBC_00410]
MAADVSIGDLGDIELCSPDTHDGVSIRPHAPACSLDVRDQYLPEQQGNLAAQHVAQLLVVQCFLKSALDGHQRLTRVAAGLTSVCQPL